MKPKNALAAKECDKWCDRVIYDVSFKEDTKANLSRLDEIAMVAFGDFVTIAANSEPLVYKICRYYIESGQLKNDDFALLDGAVLESYLGDDSAEWKKKERIDDFFQIFGEDYRNKWLVVPLCVFEISVGLAVYFMTQLKKMKVTGFIFYAEGPNNLTEIMSLNVEDAHFYEFPVKKYRKRKRQLVDDEW